MSVTSVSSVFFSFFSLGQLDYVRLHQVTSVYVGGTGRGARQYFRHFKPRQIIIILMIIGCVDISCDDFSFVCCVFLGVQNILFFCSISYSFLFSFIFIFNSSLC